ncbi:MAG: hypothetical protein KZQ92_21745 [Candidatus Thiodiazotropha sp. (ex Lucinoma borealis)]|nr:hypothetical protein [Candidatus Thiodiazotropha sp. (ex Lucinoma borealis)]MCU7855468.1 hypothetical protein [Candidatus Thiodiazotropha sp. (ex Lucinoma borealis)]MCU7866586.1 hypothetical protein [Candidatus Thiodiazotropha sp. (ex Lucinoma borealis)]MCU7868583.1 hypothetical protein [Candidatus Thiodiazotropha sp. (ex Lucinoma borealis)]
MSLSKQNEVINKSMRMSLQLVLGLLLATITPIRAETVMLSVRDDLLLRKLQLANTMLAQISVDKAKPLRDKLTLMMESFKQSNEEVDFSEIDQILGQIAEQYRQRNNREQLVKQQDQKKYYNRLSDIKSIKEGYDFLEGKQDKNMNSKFGTDEYHTRLKRAEHIAISGEYGEAIGILDIVYKKLVADITRLRDNQTINYNLEFTSHQDEYNYEMRRYQSHKMLLELAIEERPPNGVTKIKIADTILDVEKLHSDAQILAAAQRFQDAVSKEEQAIYKLASLLRLVGFYF